MTATFHALRSLLFAVAVLLTGHGLQLTLLPLEAQALGWSDSAIGLTGSFYYLGFIVGCLTIPRLIRRVGHIRTFTVCISVAAVALLAASISEVYVLWLGLRMATGWSMAGLYTTIESWLNDRAQNEQRGRVLAVYTIISLAALVLGQFLLQVESLALDNLFPVAAMFIVAATLPVALTSRPQPSVPAEVHFSWRAVFDASQVGLVCSGLSGLVMGLLWSLGAVYVSGLTGDPGDGAQFMAAIIIGGLVVQFPIGRLSDAFDRRWVILGLGVLGMVGASLWLAVPLSGVWMYVSGFLCGGAAMPMYSVSIAHANDNAEGRFLQIASGMLMANAIGAVVGPLLYGGTELVGVVYGFMGIVFLAFLVCVVWTARRLQTHSVQRTHFEPFQPVPKTGPEVFAMDPRIGETPVVDEEPRN
ncbi:MAG TPA: MFS transporter [Pseudomonadales bacterium]